MSIPVELKRNIADSYLKNRDMLEQLNPIVMQSFASGVLEIIKREKEKSHHSHDLEILEQSMEHLKNDSTLLSKFRPETDDYDFALNDCQNLLNSMEKWLEMEGII